MTVKKTLVKYLGEKFVDELKIIKFYTENGLKEFDITTIFNNEAFDIVYLIKQFDEKEYNGRRSNITLKIFDNEWDYEKYISEKKADSIEILCFCFDKEKTELKIKYKRNVNNNDNDFIIYSTFNKENDKQGIIWMDEDCGYLGPWL